MDSPRALRERIDIPPRVTDLSGKVFGRLKCLYPVERRSNGHTLYACECECGARVYATCSNMKSCHTQSCGCLQIEVTSIANRTHGKSQTKTYRRWCQMIQRCHKPYAQNYPAYGGRGIRVCDRWRYSFENFLADMGEAPEGKWIERQDNDGDYTPENCMWATPSEQGLNTRRAQAAQKVELDGVVRSLRQWGDAIRLHPETIRKRLARGWSEREALTP